MLKTSLKMLPNPIFQTVVYNYTSSGEKVDSLQILDTPSMVKFPHG